jgi:predicted MFS family arabinose efflux permease
MTVLFELPIFAYSPQIMKKVSATQLMMIAHAAYCVRVVGYTFIGNFGHGWILLLEPLHGVTFACFQLTAVVKLGKLAPPNLSNSIQGVRSTVTNLGRIIGSILGGYILQHYGATTLYRSYAAVVGGVGILYGLSEWYLGEEPIQPYATVQEELDPEDDEIELTLTAADFSDDAGDELP